MHMILINQRSFNCVQLLNARANEAKLSIKNYVHFTNLFYIKSHNTAVIIRSKLHRKRTEWTMYSVERWLHPRGGGGLARGCRHPPPRVLVFWHEWVLRLELLQSRDLLSQVHNSADNNAISACGQHIFCVSNIFWCLIIKRVVLSCTHFCSCKVACISVWRTSERAHFNSADTLVHCRHPSWYASSVNLLAYRRN